MTSQDKIDNATIEILKAVPTGVRFTPLWKQVKEALPGENANSVFVTVSTIANRRPNEVTRPSRGLYCLVGPSTIPNETASSEPKVGPKCKESDFYKPFAEWLIGELEECTKAMALGGNKFGDKWGTPDVIGVREPRKSDIIQFPTEIVSAEIKLDATGLVTAFGQACAYRLFSHKSYLVVPAASSDAELSRLDVLCRISGIGLIRFNSTDPTNPDFQIRVRASVREPDMFYVNKNLKLIESELFG